MSVGLSDLAHFWLRPPYTLSTVDFPEASRTSGTFWNVIREQSFTRIGLWLPDDFFSHGQLYAKLSRRKT